MKVGIVGAMESEVRDVLAEMEGVVSVERAGQRFHEGTLRGCSVVLARCGVGKVNAALFTQILVDRYAPDCVVNTGIAGNLGPDNRIGDVIVSTELAFHDIRGLPRDGFWPFVSYYRADPRLVELAEKACEEAGVPRRKRGVVATGDQFCDSRAEKERIRAELGAECVEMEGAAIAQACCLSGLPFVVIRTVSDDADENSTRDFAAFEEESARVSSRVVAAFCALASGLSAWRTDPPPPADARLFG